MLRTTLLACRISRLLYEFDYVDPIAPKPLQARKQGTSAGLLPRTSQQNRVALLHVTTVVSHLPRHLPNLQHSVRRERKRPHLLCWCRILTAAEPLIQCSH